MAAALALLSSLLWGTSDFFGGLTSRRLPPLAVYGVSVVFGTAVLLVAATVTGSWGGDLGYVPWGIAAGLSGMGGMVLFYKAMAIGPMGIVSPLVGMAVIVPVGVGLLRGEQPTSVQTLGIVLAVAGILLASGPELGDPGSKRSVVIAALSMSCFGVTLIAMAEGSASGPLMTVVTMRLAVMTVLIVVVAATRSLGGVRRSDAPVLAVVGLTDAAANVSFAVATTLGLLSTTAVLSSMYPVVTALLAAVFLHERLRGVQYAGVALVMAGIVAVSVG